MKIGKFECTPLNDLEHGPYCKEALQGMLNESADSPTTIYSYFGLCDETHPYPRYGNVYNVPEGKSHTIFSLFNKAILNDIKCIYNKTDEVIFDFTGSEEFPIYYEDKEDVGVIVVAYNTKLYIGVTNE